MKQKGEKVDSVILVKDEMKEYKGYTWIASTMVIGILAVGYSCGTGKQLAEQPESSAGVATDKPVELNQRQLSEYNYALTEATKQKVFGNLQQAAALYMKCIEVNPGSDVAYYQLGGLYIRARDLENAKKYSRKALEMVRDNYWYYMQLVSLYQYEGNRDSTIMLYEEMLERWPEKVNIQFELARNYAEAGRYEEALNLLNRIERENGLSEQVSMLKEQVYNSTNRLEEAADEILKLLEVAPDDIRYLGLLAEMYGSLRRGEEALELYRKIFEIEPEYGLAQLSVAEFYRESGDHKKRFEYLDTAFRNPELAQEKKLEVMIGLLTDNAEIQTHGREIERLIHILMELYPDEYRTHAAYGDFLVKKERYDEAIEQFEEVISRNKTNYFVWEQLAFLYNNRDDQEKVYAICSEAIELFPERPLMYLFKGNIEAGREEYQKGIQTLLNGVEVAGNNKDLLVQFYSFIAEAYRNKGSDTESDKYFEKALELDPGNLLLLNNYSYYLALRDVKLEDAEKMSRITIGAEPENPTYLDTYAWILYKQGKNRKALEYMDTAIRNGGDEDPEILEHYGDVLYRMNRKEDAYKYWQKAIEFGADKELIRKKIEE